MFPSLSRSSALSSTSRVYNFLSRGVKTVSYYARPVPTVERADIAGLLQSHARRTTTGARGVGPRLDPVESVELGRARRTGVLVCSAGKRSRQLANSHLKYCWAARRCYVAVDAHGVTVTVDARPLAGLAKEATLVAEGEARVALAINELIPRAISTLQSGAFPGLQISNAATMAADASKLLPGPREGSNTGRTPDKKPASNFTLFAPSREAARDAAALMHENMSAAFGWRSAADAAAASVASSAVRATRERGLLLRRLARLAADPMAVKNLRVPSGAIEGYVKAASAGVVVMSGGEKF